MHWQPPGGIAPTGYSVWRALAEGGSFQPLGGGPATAFADTSVQPGHRYHYTMAATGPYAEQSPESATLDVFVPFLYRTYLPLVLRQ